MKIVLDSYAFSCYTLSMDNSSPLTKGDKMNEAELTVAEFLEEAEFETEGLEETQREADRYIPDCQK